MDENPLEIVPSDGIEGVDNCVVVKEGQTPEAVDIMRAAVENRAFVDNSDDETGDDLHAVQFPGHSQELLDQDGIAARIRELLGIDAGE